MISFVATYYERNPRPLENCLLTLDFQTVPPLEVIVVDQNTRKPKQLEVRSVCDRYSAKYILATRKAFNMSWAFNVGIKAAKGNYIVCIGAEMLFSHNYVEVITEMMTPDIFLSSHCGFLQQGRDLGGILGNWAELCDSARARSEKGVLPDSPPGRVIGGFQGAHRDWWHKVRGYNEKLPLAWTDSNLERRAKESGLRQDRVHFEKAQMLHPWHQRSLLVSRTMRVRGSKEEYLTSPIVCNPDEWGEVQRLV